MKVALDPGRHLGVAAFGELAPLCLPKRYKAEHRAWIIGHTISVPPSARSFHEGSFDQIRLLLAWLTAMEASSPGDEVVTEFAIEEPVYEHRPSAFGEASLAKLYERIGMLYMACRRRKRLNTETPIRIVCKGNTPKERAAQTVKGLNYLGSQSQHAYDAVMIGLLARYDVGQR